MPSELWERMERMTFEGDVPCGDPVIRMQCYTCSVLRPKDVECRLENMVSLHRTEGYCKTSDDGNKCGKCTHFSYDMDDCAGNGYVAAIYRLVMNIKDDDRKFASSDRKGGPVIIWHK